MIRKILIAAIVLVAGYGALAAGLYAAMTRPPEQFGAIMSHVPGPAMIILPFRPLWMSARAGNLQVGDQAPDFILPTIDRSKSVQFSKEWAERPVVLVFGSYT